MIKKHIKFILGLIVVPILNDYNKRYSKYVYTHIGLYQFFLMVYKDMSRLQEVEYIKQKKMTTLETI